MCNNDLQLAGHTRSFRRHTVLATTTVTAIDSSFAARELIWKPPRNFRDGSELTIEWYLNYGAWWQPLPERAGRY